MSLDSIQNSISSVQRDIESLQNRLTGKARDEASKTDRIAQINRSISKSTSASSIESKQRDMQRLQEEIARIQHDKADLTKRIAEKTAALHRHQTDFYEEQGREQKQFTDALERERREQGHRQQPFPSVVSPTTAA
jgi:chromosome segregation ATPase